MNTRITGTAAGPGANFPPRRLRILVADDNRDTVLSIAMLLREDGHEVRSAYTGNEALLIARNQTFDAIILDIEMPAISGYAVAQELRRHYYNVRGPLLIALSGKWNRASEKLLSRAVGFDHHVEKPFDPSLLSRLLAPLTLPPEARGST